MSSDQNFVANVSGTLTNLKFPFSVIAESTKLKDALLSGQYEICLFDEYMARGDKTLLDLACENPRNIVCTDGDEFATIRLLATYPNVNHVYGKNKPYYDVELTTALNKIASGRLDGIESYLACGTKIQSIVIDDYAKRSVYLDGVQSFAQELNCFPDFPDMVATVTWELLMNAMFDAPFDFEKNVPKYADYDRSQPLKMQPGEEVHLSFGADNASFVVSVRDNFGKLTRNTVVNCLERCSRAGEDQVRSGNAGAGVGLYMLFNSISQVNFNIVPNKKTEVIFAVSLSKRLKDFVLRARSVNFYVGT